MIRFQNDSVVVELRNNATAIFLRWKGFPRSTQYREGLEKSLAIAMEYKTRNWISDIRHLDGIGLKDQQWVGEVWLPKAVSNGCYKKQAVIVSAHMEEKISALNVDTSIQNQVVEIRHFTNLKDAREWLEKR